MAQIVFLISMHRSGSSLVARGLECCEVTLGQSLMPGQPDNPKGFFEDTRVSSLNERILTIMDYQWSLIGTEPKVLHKNELKDLTKKATSLLKSKVGESESDLSVGIKDPRLCRLAEFWFSICEEVSLPYNVIFLVRDHNEVSQSLYKRNNIPFEAGYALWLDYLFVATKQLRNTEMLFIQLDSFCESIDTHTHAIADFLGNKVDLTELNTYIEEFYDERMLHKAEVINPIKSPTYKFITTLQSGFVLSKKDVTKLHALCTREKQTKPALKGYLAQLNWHRVAESQALRESIYAYESKIDKLKLELNSYIQKSVDNIEELRKNILEE